MRTTVTLDPDVEAFVRRAMRERGLSFKQAVNDAIRAGMTPRRRRGEWPFETHEMGEPLVDVTKALRIAAELEDEERGRRLAQGK